MKTLNVMTLDFTYLASIKGVESAIISRNWESVSTLELVIKSDILNADLIEQDCIVWFDKEYSKAFIVESIEESLSKGVSELNIKAKHISSLLSDYITVPYWTLLEEFNYRWGSFYTELIEILDSDTGTSTVENSALNLVDDYNLSFYNLLLSYDTQRDAVYAITLDLYDEIESILETQTLTSVAKPLIIVELNSSRALAVTAIDSIKDEPTQRDYDIVSGTREVVARHWVNNNAVNPVDTARKQYPIVLGDLQGYGEEITAQTRFTNLTTELYRILSTEFLSFRLDLDIKNSQFVFNVLKGVDRTVDAPNVSNENERRDVDEDDFNEGTLFDVEYDDGLRLSSTAGDPTWNNLGDWTWNELIGE